MTNNIIQTEDGSSLLTEWGDPLLVEGSIHSHGRQGIGVVQSQAGIDFPLVRPSEDVRYLLADFHISFDQPSDYAAVAAFRPPFRIYWMSGFGTIAPDYPIPTRDDDGSWSSVCTSASSSASGQSMTVLDCLPLPRHEFDIILVDADDRVVFDSTDPQVTCEAREWGERLCVVTWRHPTDQFVSLVLHTMWGPTGTPTQRDYPTYFFPTAAILDERTVMRLPKRLRSLTVILDNMRRTGVEFLAGYNMAITAGDAVEVDGKRRATRVTFNATPGAGLGIFPDCATDPLQVATLNGIAATSNGDFYLSATDCYWVRQPTRLVSTSPRLSLPESVLTPGSIPTTGLPSPLAGTTKDAPGWPVDDDPRYAHLQFGSSCEPCCDCPDYVAVAEYMNAVHASYKTVGKKIEGSRDLYHINRERWLASRDCLSRKPLRLRLLPQLCPFIDVSLQVCNQTGECLIDVELKVLITTAPNGGQAVEVPGFTFISGANTRPGSTAPVTDRYMMGGTFPEFTAFFDAVQPGQSAHVRFRLSFADCGMLLDTPYAVTGTLTAEVKGQPLQITDPENPGATIDAEAIETRVLNCPGIGNTLNYLACACET